MRFGRDSQVRTIKPYRSGVFRYLSTWANIMPVFVKLLRYLCANKKQITFAAAACVVQLNCMCPALAQNLDKDDPDAPKTVLFSEWLLQQKSTERPTDVVRQNALRKTNEKQLLSAEPNDLQQSIIFQKIADAMINALRAQCDINQDNISAAVTRAIEESKKDLVYALFAVMIFQIVLVAGVALLMILASNIYRKIIVLHEDRITPPNLVPSTTDLVPSTTDLVPPTTDLVPSTTDLVPPTTDLVPPTTDLVPSTTDLVPSTTDLVSAVFENDLRCFMDGVSKR